MYADLMILTQVVPWRLARARLTGVVLAAMSLFGAAGCAPDGSEPTGPGNHHEGLYELSKIDLNPPPVVIHHGPWYDEYAGTFFNLYVVEVLGGEIELENHERFHLTLTSTVNGDGETRAAAFTITGSYEIDGDEIRFTADDDNLGTTVAQIAGGEIVVTMDPMGKGRPLAFIFAR
jgi:hypothetical protein